MNLPPLAWHNRFRQQARWTLDLRVYLLERVGLPASARLLEVGCGTGAVLSDLPTGSESMVVGLDLNAAYLKLARRHAPRAHLSRGDAYQLPYRPGSFDVTYCHFVLLWLARPAAALAEMVRVTRPGGAVLALAEPDYGGRIDYPDELAALGAKQATALKNQGADPILGRRLAALLIEAGLDAVESGVLGGRWVKPPSQEALALEWEILRSDLGNEISKAELAAFQTADTEAWSRRKRILYVPTFYAWGRK